MFKRCAFSALCALLCACAILGGAVPYTADNVNGADIGQDERLLGVPLPILMYHVICPGRRERYAIPPETLEMDFKYIKEHGYIAVTIADLINFQEKNIPLPEKPIMLTFDDGNRTNYIHAFPLLKKYGLTAVMSIVGAFVDSNYGADGEKLPNCKTYLTYAQIREMRASGVVEIQNHSYNLHVIGKRNGMKPMRGEERSAYEACIRDDLFRLERRLEEETGFRCTAVAFPFGAYTKETLTVVKKLGYKASLTCTESMNYISPQTDLFLLKRFNRPANKSAAQILG